MLLNNKNVIQTFDNMSLIDYQMFLSILNKQAEEMDKKNPENDIMKQMYNK